jgi:RNA polymerase-binding transcription factor DksA
MDEIRKRLELELTTTMDRIRRIGGGVVFEDFPGAMGDNTPLADEVDVIRVNEDREMSFATRSLLVERANKLALALERLRGGEYGVCQECDEAIAPARLRAMPEVTTCVRCQDRLERSSARLSPVGVALGAEEAEDE